MNKPSIKLGPTSAPKSRIKGLVSRSLESRTSSIRHQDALSNSSMASFMITTERHDLNSVTELDHESSSCHNHDSTNIDDESIYEPLEIRSSLALHPVSITPKTMIDL